MNKYQLWGSFLLSLLSVFKECHVAQSVSFSLLPPSQSIISGNSLTVDIQVSDLSDTEAIAGFDLTVDFDENLLTFASFDF